MRNTCFSEMLKIYAGVSVFRNLEFRTNANFVYKIAGETDTLKRTVAENHWRVSANNNITNKMCNYSSCVYKLMTDYCRVTAAHTK